MGSMLKISTGNSTVLKETEDSTTFDDRFLKKSIENDPRKYVTTLDATIRLCHSLVRRGTVFFRTKKGPFQSQKKALPSAYSLYEIIKLKQ